MIKATALRSLRKMHDAGAVAPARKMNITLNGEKKTVPEAVSILDLLDLLKIKPERVAVELNLDIVRKHAYASTAIKEGDSLEIVSFMQGGSHAFPGMYPYASLQNALTNKRRKNRSNRI